MFGRGSLDRVGLRADNSVITDRLPSFRRVPPRLQPVLWAKHSMIPNQGHEHSAGVLVGGASRWPVGPERELSGVAVAQKEVDCR